jgi:hypothetical protein
LNRLRTSLVRVTWNFDVMTPTSRICSGIAYISYFLLVWKSLYAFPLLCNTCRRRKA